MEQLKTCPFCGGKAEIVPNKFYSKMLDDWKVDSYGVVCKRCHASGYQFWGTEKQAIEAWNRRAYEKSSN